MIERLKVRKTLAAAGAAVIAAMGLGGAAIAQSGGTATATKTSPPVTQKADGPEKGEKADGPEKGEASEGKEVPGDDGPGGHADEPGNPNADHQFQGKE